VNSKEQYETLIMRSWECEMLSMVVKDLSIRQKCAALAVEYRVLAEGLKQSDRFEVSLN
jgi:hypothetical protein